MSVRKLSPSDLKRATGVSGKQNKTIPWHTTQLTVRQFLPLNEYLAVISSIIKDCTGESKGALALSLLDFAQRVNIVEAFAFIDLPSDPVDLYELMYMSDLYETVCRHINQGQLQAIKDSIKLYVNTVWGVNE